MGVAHTAGSGVVCGRPLPWASMGGSLNPLLMGVLSAYLWM